MHTRIVSYGYRTANICVRAVPYRSHHSRRSCRSRIYIYYPYISQRRDLSDLPIDVCNGCRRLRGKSSTTLQPASPWVQRARASSWGCCSTRPRNEPTTRIRPWTALARYAAAATVALTSRDHQVQGRGQGGLCQSTPCRCPARWRRWHRFRRR